MVKTNKTRKKNKKKNKKRIFKKKDFISGDGMMTAVWGPSMWHYLHTLSFNYPIHPTKENKKYYKDQILILQYTLPCKYCRMNLTNNLKTFPLKTCHMKDRNSFSRYVYQLHETVNKMLGKKSGLSYCDVRERYEHFRARCTTLKSKQNKKFNFTRKKSKEKGCTEPLYGKKAKCVIKIVPKTRKCKSFQIDNTVISK